VQLKNEGFTSTEIAAKIGGGLNNGFTGVWVRVTFLRLARRAL
jgi:hypothetical protein